MKTDKSLSLAENSHCINKKKTPTGDETSIAVS